MKTHSRQMRPLAAAVGVLTAVSLLSPVHALNGSPRHSTTLVSLRDAGSSFSMLSQAIGALGGRVVESFQVAGAAVVELPVGAQLPPVLMEIPSTSFRFSSVPARAVAPVPGATFRDTIGAPDDAGSGVKVALIDTGVADVPGVTVASRINVSGDTTGDGYGHGTFMAGLIAGNGEFPGTAPQASIVDVQVADHTGATDLRRVLAGVQAVADLATTDPSVRVVNLSLSSGSPLPPAIDPLARGLERLWARGITVVVPSGNDGAGTVGSPGNDPVLLTVGASDEAKSSTREDDSVAEFSGFGRSFGHKPDLVAPGVSLISLRAPGSIADVENPSSRLGENYFHGSGTSMSTAVTSGAVAALVAARDFSPDQVKQAFVQTAFSSPTLTRKLGAGAGELDLRAALASTPKGDGKLQKGDSVSTVSPDPDDSAMWQEFSRAWAAGDREAALAAWRQLTPQTRRWAGVVWGLGLISAALASGDSTGLATLGRRWHGEAWSGRRWHDQAWDGRRWHDQVWDGRRWHDLAWDGRRWHEESWDGRRWHDDAWLEMAWSGRRWHSDTWAGDAWSGNPSEAAWAGRRWHDVAWSTSDWMSQFWSGRRWHVAQWDAVVLEGRRWHSSEWAETELLGRRWHDAAWSGAQGWTGGPWAGMFSAGAP